LEGVAKAASKTRESQQRDLASNALSRGTDKSHLGSIGDRAICTLGGVNASTQIANYMHYPGSPRIPCTCSLCHEFISFWYLWYVLCISARRAEDCIYSSSPKKTLIGSHESPQTLKRSGSESISFISSAVSSQPSSWKLPWMREAVTDLGMTELPLWRPHIRRTC
jgi:hypothetical protein